MKYENVRPGLPKSHRHQFQRPPWATVPDLISLTDRLEVAYKLGVALETLLTARELDVACLAMAAGVSVKHVNNILDGAETPSPEVIDQLIDGFALQGRPLLREEIAQVEWLLRQMRHERRERTRPDEV